MSHITVKAQQTQKLLTLIKANGLISHLQCYYILQSWKKIQKTDKEVILFFINQMKPYNLKYNMNLLFFYESSFKGYQYR